MFDSICVRQTGFGNEPALDLGLLAEALLFYQRPVLIMNRAIFIQLLESLGPDGLLRLARSERLSCAYCNQFTGVSTEDVAGPTKRFFMAIAEMTHTAIDQLATEEFRRVTGKSGRGRRLAEKFFERITDVRLDPSISESATADALKASYASSLLADGLKVMAPSYRVPEGIAFELQPVADGRLKLQTNLDLGDINRHWRFGQDQAITAAHCLDWILKVHEEFAYAGHFASEMVTNPFTTALPRTKTADLLAREQSAAAQAKLQDLVFDDSRAVRESINSGQRSLLDALEIADRGRRFRDWTSDLEPDHALVRDYIRACTSEGWLDQLPGKAARFVVVTGAGTGAALAVTGPLGIAAGPVIGAIDF